MPSRLRTRSGARGADESIVSVARAEVVGLDEVEEEVAARTAGAPAVPAVPADGPWQRPVGTPGIVELVASPEHVVPSYCRGPETG